MKRLLDKLDQSTKTIWPAIIWSALIFILLTIPSSKLPDESLIPIPHFDKIIHISLFAGFTFLWAGAYISKKTSFNRQLLFIKLVLIAFSYGALLEFIQLKLERSCNIFDMVANLIGALTGLTMKKITPF
ncbi:MAG: VanZ family protein [Bacteroidota bacterium]